MVRFLTQLAALWKQLGINQKISLVLATALVVAVMAGMLVWSSRPDMQLLYGRLDPKDAADIAAALDTEGIPYQVSAGGTTIHVPRSAVHRVRMDLASKGLPTGGSVGFEIFDRGNFGISDFVQRTNYLRAIQGELARTISQLDGVRSARVMVVMPENRLLVTDASRRSTASVLVDTGGSRLPTEGVNSIRSLVANAVEGLRLEDVVVVDNRGNVLSEELQQDGLGAGLTAGQIRYRKNLEDYFSRKVESMLATVLGPSNAVVRVSVDVDTSSSTVTEERFDPDAQILRNSTVTEDSTTSTEARDAAAAVAGGAAGAGAGGEAPVSNSQQTRKTKTEAYEIGKSVINTVRNAGEIRRITAAVFVAMPMSGTGETRTPNPRTPEQVESLRRMVVNALGVVPARGQTLDQIVTVQEVDFVAESIAGQADSPAAREVPIGTWVELGQKVLVVVLAATAFFFFLRLIKRGQAEAPSLELFNPRDGLRRGAAGELDREVTPALLNEMIQQKPGNVSLTLKEWMSAGQK